MRAAYRLGAHVVLAGVVILLARAGLGDFYGLGVAAACGYLLGWAR